MTLRLWKKNCCLSEHTVPSPTKTVHVVFMVKAMPKGRGNVSEGQSLAVARLLIRFSWEDQSLSCVSCHVTYLFTRDTSEQFSLKLLYASQMQIQPRTKGLDGRCSLPLPIHTGREGSKQIKWGFVLQTAVVRLWKSLPRDTVNVNALQRFIEKVAWSGKKNPQRFLKMWLLSQEATRGRGWETWEEQLALSVSWFFTYLL